jgi:hypothetical protein
MGFDRKSKNLPTENYENGGVTSVVTPLQKVRQWSNERDLFRSGPRRNAANDDITEQEVYVFKVSLNI